MAKILIILFFNVYFFMKQLIYIILLLLSFGLNAQDVSQKLLPVNIIGTAISVDYDNNNAQSTTVNTIANVFDGNANTFFASYQRSGGWVGLDLGERHVITKVAYRSRRDWQQRLLLGVFEGANNPDFGDAIPLLMITQTPQNNVMTEQPVDCSRGFRYVRYVGPSDVRCNIAELEFWGYKGNGNDTKLYQTTNIPDVIIHTTNAQDILNREVYVRGVVSFISENGTQIYTDSLGIRGRGNASWGFPKKPYRIRLDNRTNLLGLPARERVWTLINNYGDKTLMRNLLAFDLSKRLQMPFTPAGIPVNVYLNGEFKGCYQLCDQVQIAPNRIDIQEISPADIALPNLSGGYHIEISQYAFDQTPMFVSNRGVPVRIRNPGDGDIVPAQSAYIRNYFNEMEAAVFSANYRDPVNGYRKYLEMETFIRHFLVGEISGNTDTYWSVHIYKRRNDNKFYFGPVWDFDIAYENDNRTYPINSNPNWIYATTGSSANNARIMINRMMTDAELVEQIKYIYAYYRNQNFITVDALLTVVDNYAAELEASQILNFTRWNIMNTFVHQNPRLPGSYAAEVENVKRYISNRIAWMDKKLEYSPPLPPTPPPPPPPPHTANEANYLTDASVRGYGGNINIEGIVATTLVEVFNVSGSMLFSKTINGDASIPFDSGIYIVRLSNAAGDVKVFTMFF